MWQNELPDQHISLRELLEQLKMNQIFFVGEDVEKFTEEIAQIIPHGKFVMSRNGKFLMLQFWLR